MSGEDMVSAILGGGFKTVVLLSQDEHDEVAIALAQWADTCEWRARPGNRQHTREQREQYARRAATIRALIDREEL